MLAASLSSVSLPRCAADCCLAKSLAATPSDPPCNPDASLLWADSVAP